MCFVFKLLFAYIGFQAARWLHINELPGLIFGLFVGHIVDHAATYRFARWRAQRLYAAQARKEFDNQFIGSLFLMLGHICGADGVISKTEIEAVERVMTDMLQLNRKSRHKAVQNFREARRSTVPFQMNAVKYFELYHNHPEILESTIQMLLGVAASDAPLNEAEQRLIDTAATIFGITAERLAQLKRLFPGPSGNGRTGADFAGTAQDKQADAYTLLGCDRRASVEDIKKCYRKLVLEYHPDTIISKNLPEDFIKFANHKFNSIQQAYEQIKAERGFN